MRTLLIFDPIESANSTDDWYAVANVWKKNFTVFNATNPDLIIISNKTTP